MGARKIGIGALGLSLAALGVGCRIGAFDELSSGGGARDAATEAGEQPDADELDGDETGPMEDAGSPDATSSGDGDGGAALDASGPDADAALDSGAPSDTGTSADATSPSDGGGADAGDAGTDAAAPDAGPITRVFEIQKDEDDALWRIHSGDLEELLHFDPDTQGSADFTIEVGTDSEECRAGLRFSLPLARGSRLVSARLSLMRVGGAGNVSATSTMRVSVFDTDNVPVFVSGHAHATPALHVPSGGLWSTSVGGFVVGPTNAAATSQDLSVLVQHVIDRPGWIPGAYVGFVISPDTFASGEYMQIADFEAPGAAAPRLSLTYYPP